jgi:hypothetical protein
MLLTSGFYCRIVSWAKLGENFSFIPVGFYETYKEMGRMRAYVSAKGICGMFITEVMLWF